MKKILFTILCAGAVMSCSKEEVITVADQEAITFESAFVEKATKAAYDGSYNNNNLNEFQVYATISGTGTNEGTANIFNGELVVKGASLGQGINWSYATANTQYWIPGNDYKFRAIAEGNVTDVTTVTADGVNMATAINLLDASAQKDILVAEHSVVNYTKPQNGAPAPVAFTFDHILAKAKFTVKNTITTNNGYSYKVYNLSLDGIAKNGVYTFGEGWAEAATRENYDLAFGHAVVEGTAEGVATPANIAYNRSVESNYDRLLIPTVAEELNVSFTYELLKDGVVIDTQDKALNTGALSLLSGSSYNFVISLGNPGDPIQFDVVKVNDWVEAGNRLVNAEVATTFAELQSLVAKGEDVVLAQDITIAAGESLTIPANSEVSIDLGGKTLTAESCNFVNEGKLFLSNGTVSGVATQAGRQAIVNKAGAELTISDVTVNQVYTAGGSAINNSGKCVINSATVNASNMAISNKNGAEMTINNGTFVGNGTGLSYCICNQLGSTLTVNGGTFIGGHGSLSSTESSVATLNAGTFKAEGASAYYAIYAASNGVVKYNASKVTLSSPTREIYVESGATVETL